jgi:hypothetical protein
MNEIISTPELIRATINNPNKFVEAKLFLKNNLIATHFLYYNGKNLFDEGIDGEERMISSDVFLAHYTNGQWRIDNVV